MRWCPDCRGRSRSRERVAVWGASTKLIVSVAAAAAHRICRRLLPVLGMFLLVLFSFEPIVAAQSRFDVWTTENGLPQNSVNDIVQTRDGYLWLATFGGLVRFDGIRFAVFDRSVPGIKSQRVRALHEDRHGTLWAATEDGMLIRHRDGRFQTYTGEDGLPHAVAIRIEECDEGRLWITWFGGRITRFDGQRFLNIGADQVGHGVSPPPETRLWDVWWSRDAGGLHALVNGRVRTYAVPGELIASPVTGINADKRGNLWIRTAGGGVIKAAHGRYVRYTTGEGLPNDHPDGIFNEDSKGNIWFWDHSDNLYRIRDGEHQRVDFPAASSVGSRSFYEDREGSVWFGTSVAGLHRLREETIALYTKRDGLSLNMVYSILEDRKGAFWIGTWDGGLNRYARGRFTSYGRAEGLPSVRVTCIYEDRSGRLWVGTHYQGLAYLDGDRFRRYRDPSGFLSGNVWAVQEDRAGTFWFATDNGLVESSDGRFARYTTKDGLSHDRITALFEDRSGALWIGAFHGVTRLKDGRFTTYTERNGFIGNSVRAFHEDGDGILWIGTYDGGLYRLSDERLTRYTRNDGLHDNGVFQILEDDDGYLWMGSNTGIYRVNRAELNELAEGRRRSVTPLVLGPRDGLASVEVNGGRQPAGLKAADGRLWFPTMGGLARVDPAAVRIETPPPRAIIEEFRLAGEPVDLAQELRMPPNTPAFEIRYTAPTFIKPEHVRFRYRLVGLDDEWVEAGERRSVSFYRIPPGKYTFVVTASNHVGAWDTEGGRLEIAVLPPFWRTWWFMAATLTVLGVVLFAGHERRVRRVRREHARQRAFTQQLIDSQERERSRISSEIHDSVGHDLAMVKKRAETGKDLVARNDAAREEFTEIFTAAERIDMEMKEIARGLRPYHLDKIGLSRSIQGMLRRVERSCHLAIAADIADIDDVFERGSHVHVYRIVQEAISNVIRHSGATRARIAIARDSTSVEIRIEDNGKGLTPEPRDSADPAARGFGLMGMHERARILGGEVQIRSGETHGTTIVARFRLEDGGT